MPTWKRERLLLGWLFILALVLFNYYVWSRTPSEYFASPVYWLGYVGWGVFASYTILVERRVPPYDSRVPARWVVVGSPPMWVYDWLLTVFLLAMFIVIILSRIYQELAIPLWSMAGICGGLAVHTTIFVGQISSEGVGVLHATRNDNILDRFVTAVEEERGSRTPC